MFVVPGCLLAVEITDIMPHGRKIFHDSLNMFSIPTTNPQDTVYAWKGSMKTLARYTRDLASLVGFLMLATAAIIAQAWAGEEPQRHRDRRGPGDDLPPHRP
jgi:hypothetical protein